MQVLELESIKKNKISIFLINIENYKVKFNKLRKLMDYFKYKTVEFVTVDYEDENLKDFTDTSLSLFLKELRIPYFPIYIPKHTKNYFKKVIIEKENQIKEFLDDYKNLKKQDSKKGYDLKSKINLYLEQQKENTDFFNFKIKPQYITETILRKIENSKKDEIIIIHFGREKTFTEIMKILKEVNININIFYLHYLGY